MAALAAVLWGLAPVMTKLALAAYSPELTTTIRLAATALVFRLRAGRGTSWLVREPWTWVAGGALGADFVLYNHGLRHTSAALAGLVINVEIVSGIAFACWLLGEALTARRAVGAAVTLAGVLVVASEGVRLGDLLASERLAGNLLVMGAGVTWSLYAAAQRRAPRDGNVFRLLTPIFSVAFLVTLPALLRPGALATAGGVSGTAALGALVLLCTVGVYLVYARSQECLDVAVLAIVLSSIPVFAVAFAWVVLGEPLTPRMLTGGGVILGGVLIVASEPAQPP